MSAHKEVIGRYFEGFRPGNHDDIVWDLPGYRHLVGKDASRANPGPGDSPWETAGGGGEGGHQASAVSVLHPPRSKLLASVSNAQVQAFFLPEAFQAALASRIFSMASGASASATEGHVAW